MPIKQFEAIVNRSPAVLILWRVADGYYPVEFVSENVRQFGYTADELMSAHDAWGDITHPDDVARIKAEVVKYFDDGTLEFSQEYRIRTKSGQIRWIEDRNLALTNKRGVVTHVQGVVLDVTERKLAEQRYEHSEGRFRAMSEAALDAVVMMDPLGNVAHWNPAAEKMFGYSYEEIFGHGIHQTLVPPEYRERAEKQLRKFAKSGTGPAVGKVLELSALRKDGSRFPIEISVAPIRLEQGWGSVGIIRDITGRKWAEDAVAREQRQLRRALEVHERERAMLADEIHDGFVQPLTAALMNIEASLVGLEDYVSPAAREQYADALRLFRNSIGRARQLMSRLRPAILDQFGLVSAIENLVSDVQNDGGPAVAHSHKLRSKRIAGPLELAIFRIVQEGLTNACTHGKCGNVRINLSQKGPVLRIAVEDDGTGFDPARVPEGCFGLEGIRERARLFGGRASIESAPGRGTRIVVELPLVEAGPSGGEPTPEENP